MADLLYTAPYAVTQGGADTSAEVTIQTGLLPGIDLSAWEMVVMEVQLSAALVKTWAVADAHLIVQATKRSLSGGYSTLAYADTDLITQFQIANILTGAGTSAQTLTTSWWFELPPGALLYSAAMYVQVMSAGTGAANSVHGRLLYRPMRLSQNEALAIVASRP